MHLATPRLVLRDLRKDDASAIYAHVRERALARNMRVIPHPYRLKDAREFLVRCAAEARVRQRIAYHFAIELKATGELMGIVSLSFINHFEGTCVIGYWLGSAFQHQGFMSEAVAAMLEFAFKKLKLRRIAASVFSDNTASREVMRKLGFTDEGLCRAAIRDRATGAIHDECRYGLLKKDWRKPRPTASRSKRRV